MIKTFFYIIGLSYIGIWCIIGSILICAVIKHELRGFAGV